MVPTNKQIVQYFFTKAADDATNKTWVCKKCEKPRKTSNGWTNLVNHLNTCVGPNYKDQLSKHLRLQGKAVKKQASIDNFIVSNEKERRAHQIIQWIACRNMPLSEIDNPLTRSILGPDPFCSRTIRKWTVATAKETEGNIAKTLQAAGVITLLMDGWTSDGTSTHYIAMFAGFVNQHGEYDEVLLGIQPTLDEDDLGAASHIELFDSTLELCGLTKDNVACFIADNCATNRAIFSQWDVPMIGCASHRLNLAVKHWIKEQHQVDGRGHKTHLSDALESLSTLMSKACNLKAAAKLRELTHDAHGKELSAKKDQETRWTSVMFMVHRYLRIRTQLKAVDALDDFQLSKAQHKIIEEVAKPNFMIFFQLTKSLQFQTLDLLFVREEFDLLLGDPEFECMHKYLAPDADIVACPDFESGLVKIMRGDSLSVAEANACRLLKKKATPTMEDVDNDDGDEEALTTMEKLERHRNKHKKQKIQHSSAANQAYIDVFKLISPTSNSCERLFSEAKYILVPHRRGMSPVTFEALLYLKKNTKHWDVTTVAKAMRMEVEEEEGI